MSSSAFTLSPSNRLFFYDIASKKIRIPELYSQGLIGNYHMLRQVIADLHDVITWSILISIPYLNNVDLGYYHIKNVTPVI